MEIIISNNVFSINTKNSEDIIAFIYEHTLIKGLNINYLIIDGLPVYNNYQKFIEDNINSIQKITVITQSIPKLIISTLESTENYITELIEKLQEVIKDDEISHEILSQLRTNLMNDMSLMVQMRMQIDAIITEDDTIRQYSGWINYNKKIDALSDYKQTLEKFDYIGKYQIEEIIKILDELKLYAKYLKNYLSLY